MVIVIEDIEELKKIEAELERVYRNHNGWSFSSPKFILTTIKKNYDNTSFSLFFVLNRHEETLESYLPLYIDSKKTLRFLFDKHTDYCGVIGKDLNSNFLKDFAKIISQDKRIQRLDFDNLLMADPLLNGLKYYLKSGVCINAYNSHSYISSSAEKGYFNNLKARDRSELKRVLKKNTNSTFSIFAFPQAFPIEGIISLRDKMIKQKSRDNDFLNEAFLKFIKELYQKNELLVLANSLEDNMVSIVFTFKNDVQKTFMFWVTLYDQNVQYINLATYLNFISKVEFEDEYKISFGRGDYSFKATFAPKVENLYNLRFSKSKFDFFFTNYFTLKEFVKRIVKG